MGGWLGRNGPLAFGKVSVIVSRVELVLTNAGQRQGVKRQAAQGAPPGPAHGLSPQPASQEGGGMRPRNVRISPKVQLLHTQHRALDHSGSAAQADLSATVRLH